MSDKLIEQLRMMGHCVNVDISQALNAAADALEQQAREIERHAEVVAVESGLRAKAERELAALRAQQPGVVLPDLKQLEAVLDEVCGAEGGLPKPGVPLYTISLTEVAKAFARLNSSPVSPEPSELQRKSDLFDAYADEARKLGFSGICELIDAHSAGGVDERAAFEAIDWLDDFVARCNGDDRGSSESVNVVRQALQARAALTASAQRMPSVQITGHLDEVDAPVWEFINAEARKLGPLTGSIDSYGLSRPSGGQPNGGVVVLWNGQKIQAVAMAFRDAMNRTQCVRLLAEGLATAGAQSVPDGWKLVPVEATTEMVEALKARIACTSRGGILNAGNALNDAIAAAPAPGKGGAE